MKKNFKKTLIFNYLLFCDYFSIFSSLWTTYVISEQRSVKGHTHKDSSYINVTLNYKFYSRQMTLYHEYWWDGCYKFGISPYLNVVNFGWSWKTFKNLNSNRVVKTSMGWRNIHNHTLVADTIYYLPEP